MSTHPEEPANDRDLRTGGFMSPTPGEATNGRELAAANTTENEAVNGTVLPFRRSTDNTEEPGTGLAVPEAIEGELVSREESQALDRRLAAQRFASRAVQIVPTATRQAVAVGRRIGESEHTHAVAKGGVRHAYAVVQGIESWGKRAWDASTLGVYRRQIKAAEAAGNQELLREWVEAKERATQQRHERLKALPGVVLGLAKVGIGSMLALAVLLPMLGLLVWLSGSGEFLDVFTGAADAVRWVFAAFVFAWTPLLVATPFAVVFAAWREGRRRGATPNWLATAADAQMDVAIDENTITRALEALRIKQINDYLKLGMPLQFLSPARIDGRGTHAVIRLPSGVTAETIAKKRSDLATGLYRLAKEVWPTTGDEAGILDLWVADKGALAEGAGEYPLLDDGVVDVFDGVPFGKTLRGSPLMAPIMECNTLTGGMPGQGKSSAARVLLVGCALDPRVELRIWIPDANFDFEALRPRCSRYVMGAEDEKIAEILEHLRELHAEVQARGELLIKYQEPAVTRDLASRNVGLHPLVCLVEEAHVAIQHPDYGREVAKLLVDIVRLGRKRGIHLVVSTQAPTKDSMPRDVTRNCSNGIAFAVGDHVANDALLGQGAYRGGHRATELIPGTDKGTAVVKGFTGERSDIVQVYYIDVSNKNDQVTPIIDRAMAAIRQRGSLPGAETDAPVPERRDLLEDLDVVLGAEAVPSADVPALLRELAPQWAGYRKLNGKGLRLMLDRQHGIKVPATGNKYPIDPVTVREVLAKRATEDLDADD